MLEYLLLSALSFASPDFVQGSTDDPTGHGHDEPVGEFQLQEMETPAGPKSSLPNLVKGADGEMYLSWVDREADKVAVLRISRLGASSWGAPIDVVKGSDLMLNWADFPSVQVSASGVMIASWLRQASEPHGYMAEFRISTDRGKTWGPVQRLHDDGSVAEHGFVSLAPIGKDSFGAIWLDGRGMSGGGHGDAGGHGHGAGSMALYFRTISKAGELGPEIVLDPRVCDCCQTSLIALPGGGLMAAYRDRSAEEIRDISTLVYDGKSWSKPSTAHADDWKIAGCPVNGPRLALGDSLKGIAWFTVVDNKNPVAYAKVGGSDFDGLPAIPIADVQSMGRVDMVPGTNDSVLVAWMETLEDGQAEWRLRRISKAGHKGDSITIAKIPGERRVGFLRMAATGNGAVLAWTSGGDERRVKTAI
ncbi:MAG: hypothetical protein JKY61_11430, partial [Planctomycetes bacterium]|nr:hypothetical protein [Planctomycetota bacterium]